MGLLGLFDKNKKSNLNRLTEEGELPFGWIYANKDFVEATEEEYRYFFNAWLDAKSKDVLKQYAALKSLVIYMNDIKTICATKGECFAKWAEIVVANPDAMKKWTEYLHYMETHIDELLREEKMLKKLRTELKKIIQAEPGVKQEQLYKRFSPDMKNYISNELYHMAANGTIRREKSGRSYELFIK